MWISMDAKRFPESYRGTFQTRNDWLHRNQSRRDVLYCNQYLKRIAVTKFRLRRIVGNEILDLSCVFRFKSFPKRNHDLHSLPTLHTCRKSEQQIATWIKLTPYPLRVEINLRLKRILKILSPTKVESGHHSYGLGYGTLSTESLV